MNAFARRPEADDPALRRSYGHPDRGLHRFFRHSHRRMQRRFVALVDAASIPRAFLHGNPHLANYAKNRSGAAMVDFDRARLGPYLYDVVRFLVSVSLRRGDEGDGRLLHPAVLDSFRRGYLMGVGAPDLGYEEMRDLRRRSPKKWQQDLAAYLAAERAWSGRLRAHAIDPTEPRLRALLESYLTSRDEESLGPHYRIEAAASVPGSMGKIHTLLLLRPDRDDLPRRLIDVKEVYDEPDDAFFDNPFGHNGRRMVEAGRLHAPGWENEPGWATHGGVEYWVRGIPTQNDKLAKKRLTPIQQIDVAFAVGSQLGRAHHLSMERDRDAHLEHFQGAYREAVEVAAQLRTELARAHAAYLAETAPAAAVGW
ncbi:MAG TPA: DUF2252 family protein [Sandaracinaceae bacterium LLY-WYZ-13_1]|nr:DUF2252 family protein [Sandaracinaceae bacterium LLY-WYZ-13_1]